ncbi:MAG: VanZ family protein, partial [Candidatus Aureabacteria bacterium]|nr:VanZ family protein [Candidatus Auribacterota bacterium]
ISAWYIGICKQERRPWVYGGLVALCAVYACLTLSIERSIERAHLVEYVLLGMLVYRALPAESGGVWRCLWTAVVTVQFGFADECVQGLLPDRIYDLNDVLLNAKAALVACALLAIVLRPWERAIAREPARVSSSRVLTMALIVLCLVAITDAIVIERGTPTIRADVHRTDGALAHRDGFKDFGAVAICANIAAVALGVYALAGSARGRGAGAVRAAVCAGVVPPVILLSGLIFNLRFR